MTARFAAVPDLHDLAALHSEHLDAAVLIGTAVALLGFFFSLSGILAFGRADTPMFPFKPARALVQTGPYRFTRNPMYVGAIITYVGVAIAMNVVWPIILLPLVLAGLYRFVIRVEERYLHELFGSEYDAG